MMARIVSHDVKNGHKMKKNDLMTVKIVSHNAKNGLMTSKRVSRRQK